MYFRTITRAETAFRVNLLINIVVVVLGIALVASSLVFAWLNGLDVFSVAFASIGIADFVVIFFVNPQKGIHNTLGNLVQIQVAYRTYLTQLGALTRYERDQAEAGHERSLDDVLKANEGLGKISQRAMEAIREYVK